MPDGAGGLFTAFKAAMSVGGKKKNQWRDTRLQEDEQDPGGRGRGGDGDEEQEGQEGGGPMVTDVGEPPKGVDLDEYDREIAKRHGFYSGPEWAGDRRWEGFKSRFGSNNGGGWR